jgi:hypothetical protein
MGTSLTRGAPPEHSPGSGSSSSISPGGGLAALTAAGSSRRPGLPGPEHHPRPGRSAGKRYKYRALVRPVPSPADDPEVALPSPVCRVVVRARHPETHRSKLFSALVTSDDDLRPGKSSMVTVVVLGGDADDYLAPGEHFALLRGRDVARGTVTSRVFV